MLNEFKEYDDYTKDLILNVDVKNPEFKSGEIYGRLLLESITKRSGIDRALTIIARRFIFHDEKDIRKLNTLEESELLNRIKLVENYLIAWCSNHKIESDLPKELIGVSGNGRYYDYMQEARDAFNNLIARITNKELEDTKINLKNYMLTAKSIEKSIVYWNDVYLTGLIKNKFYSIHGMKNKYDNKIVTLDLIIANAIQDGPLKNHYVYFPISIFNKLIDAFEVTHRKYITDFLLTCAYYLVKKENSENDYLVINDAHMSNWLGKKNYYRSFKLFHNALSQKELFSQEIVFNVAKKISISDELTEGTLVKYDDASANNDYIVISDDLPYALLDTKLSQLYNHYYKTQKKSNLQK
ncbi:hypothetical protein [Mariniplasma anaerobium]|uniref:Uncharacterized protein n=1 Tax=Mariniplasma anaerobium TaxID=2735436 RepID=A0A7U9TKA1_9MOLU|nr:hypothetical protein [Mariniplasma anaerobium]BCR35183.1 hypothetical protein MPAN_000760 [Mariniplasma anaerobium]